MGRKVKTQEEIFDNKLNDLYGHVGKEFETREDAHEFLLELGYGLQDNGVYRSKKGEVARISLLKSTIEDGKLAGECLIRGYLVTFQRPFNPIGFRQLKLSEVPKE